MCESMAVARMRGSGQALGLPEETSLSDKQAKGLVRGLLRASNVRRKETFQAICPNLPFVKKRNGALTSFAQCPMEFAVESAAWARDRRCPRCLLRHTGISWHL